MLKLLPLLTSLLNTQPLLITTDELQIRFTPRTPDQMASFYEARGFPGEMRELLKQQCFITVGIRNTSQKKIWLDLANWRFSVNGRELKRAHRDEWKSRWQSMNIPLSKQSTFRWTLLPESLDYLPGEYEGGNIILPFSAQPIQLEARFLTGDRKQGKPIIIKTNRLFCAKDKK